jgi:hypothetical protein
MCLFGSSSKESREKETAKTPGDQAPYPPVQRTQAISHPELSSTIRPPNTGTIPNINMHPDLSPVIPPTRSSAAQQSTHFVYHPSSSYTAGSQQLGATNSKDSIGCVLPVTVGNQTISVSFAGKHMRDHGSDPKLTPACTTTSHHSLTVPESAPRTQHTNGSHIGSSLRWKEALIAFPERTDSEVTEDASVPVEGIDTFSQEQDVKHNNSKPEQTFI